MARWEDEPDPPIRLHEQSVQPGDMLGSKRWTMAFLRWLTDNPRRTDDGGYFVRPMRATLHALHLGHGDQEPHPDVAAYLWRLYQCGGDWRKAAPPNMGGEAYALGALVMCWWQYATFPMRRVA